MKKKKHEKLGSEDTNDPISNEDNLQEEFIIKEKPDESEEGSKEDIINEISENAVPVKSDDDDAYNNVISINEEFIIKDEPDNSELEQDSETSIKKSSNEIKAEHVEEFEVLDEDIEEKYCNVLYCNLQEGFIIKEEPDESEENNKEYIINEISENAVPVKNDDDDAYNNFISMNEELIIKDEEDNSELEQDSETSMTRFIIVLSL